MASSAVVVRASEVGGLREVAGMLAQRQSDFTGWLAEECRKLDQRAALADERHSALCSRLEQVEGQLHHVQEVVLPRRGALRSQRVAVLRQQVEILRGRPPPARTAGRLGTVLMYAGGLLLVWLVLWQLALAFGLR
jgi:hypothetical protein